MKAPLKKLLISVLAFLAFLVAAAVIVPLVVDVDKYRPQLVQAVNQRLNGKLELGRLSLSLWGRIRLVVEGASVRDRTGDQVLAVKDVYFHMPFSSVFSGSPELVLKMQRPSIGIIKDAQGKLNVTTLVKSAAAQGAPQPASPGQTGAEPAPEPLKLPAIATRARLTIELRDALVTYRDLATGLDTRIEALNLVLKELSLSRPTGLEVWATLDTQLGKSLTMKGPARITGTIKPELVGAKLERVAFAARADFDAVEIRVPGLFLKKKGVPAHADLSVWANEKQARIERLDARFANAELKATGHVSNLGPAPAVPVVELRLSSNDIALGGWSELVPMLKEYELGGSARLDAELRGPSDKLGYQALLKVAGLTAKAPRLKAVPRIDGTMKIITDQIESLQLTMQAPGNDLKLQGKLISFTKPRASFEVTSTALDLDRLVEFAPPGARPEASPAPQGVPQGTGASPAPQAASDYDALLKPVRENKLARDLTADLNVNLKSVTVMGVKMTELVGRAEVKDLVATVDSFAMRLWGGTVTASGSADLKPPRPTYRFSTRVRGLEIQDAVASRFQLFKNTVVGKASFEMTGEGASFNPLAARDSLKAKGKLRVDEATFATIDVAKMVTEGLNKALERVGEKVPPLRGRKVKGPPGGGSKYEFISSDFTIGGGVFRAPNFVAKALPDRGIDLKGDTTVGLRDSSLKTSWEISDTYNLTKARELGDGMLAEGKGPVRFPVSAGCTLTAPCYSYTEAPEFLAKVALGNLTRGAQGRAKEELRKKIAPKVQDKLKGIGKKFFGR